jgi:predicted acetyltransferase
MADPLEIALIAATPSDAPLLANLLELYIHDLSEAFPAIQMGPEGRFGYPKLPLYWSEPERRFAFLIHCDGRVAGFVLATRGSPASDDPEVLDVAEFFILRRYRRSGVGRHAAFLLWNRFPGQWTVRVSEGNPAAIPFWAGVTAHFSSGAVVESSRPGNPNAWRVFSFNSTPRGESAAIDVTRFQTFGFLVLRGFFDAARLGAELDQAMLDGAPSEAPGGGEIHFQYLPMMTAETPVSLALLDRLETVATTLLGGPVLPTRAKGVRYRGDTPWHTDSESPIGSLGFAAYLEPLGADDGALRMLPGSHRPELTGALRSFGAAGMAATALPAHVIATEPGDVIVFDEHLFHASSGGGSRRQWRADYVRDPADAEAERHTRAYFAGIYPPDWDGKYDVDRFPSYGVDWQRSGRRSAARLAELGVYELAAKQEAFTRSKR